MNIIVKRFDFGKDYTMGMLYIDGKYFCDTLEDKDRGLTSEMKESEILKIKQKHTTRFDRDIASLSILLYNVIV